MFKFLFTKCSFPSPLVKLIIMVIIYFVRKDDVLIDLNFAVIFQGFPKINL